MDYCRHKSKPTKFVLKTLLIYLVDLISSRVYVTVFSLVYKPKMFVTGCSQNCCFGHIYLRDTADTMITSLYVSVVVHLT